MPVKGFHAKGWTSGPETVRFWDAMEQRQRDQLAERIKGYRGDKGWTAEALAHHAGVSSKTVSRLENGRIEDPRSSTLRKLASALEVEVEVLSGPRRPYAAEEADDPIVRLEDQIAELDKKLDAVLTRLPDPEQEIERETAEAAQTAAQREKGTAASGRAARRRRQAR